MRPAAAPLALLVCALASLGGCAPTHEWVNPAAPPAMRGEDGRICQSEAAFLARRNYWVERDRLWFDAQWARSPGQRALAHSRLQQLDMYESMDRNRFFDHCMRMRGYTLMPVAPRPAPQPAPAPSTAPVAPSPQAQPLDD